MFQKILPYLIIVIGIWYLPEISLFLRNVSASIFQETSASVTHIVEVKVVPKARYFPLKFSVLSAGIQDVRVELNSSGTYFVRSGVTDEYGSVTIDSIPTGRFKLRVGKKIEYPEDEIRSLESMGQSVLDEGDIYQSSIDEIEITKDIYLVPIITQ